MTASPFRRWASTIVTGVLLFVVSFEGEDFQSVMWISTCSDVFKSAVACFFLVRVTMQMTIVIVIVYDLFIIR